MLYRDYVGLRGNVSYLDNDIVGIIFPTGGQQERREWIF